MFRCQTNARRRCSCAATCCEQRGGECAQESRLFRNELRLAGVPLHSCRPSQQTGAVGCTGEVFTCNGSSLLQFCPGMVPARWPETRREADLFGQAPDPQQHERQAVSPGKRPKVAGDAIARPRGPPDAPLSVASRTPAHHPPSLHVAPRRVATGLLALARYNAALAPINSANYPDTQERVQFIEDVLALYKAR